MSNLSTVDLPCSMEGVEIGLDSAIHTLTVDDCHLVLVDSSPIAICISCNLIFRGYNDLANDFKALRTCHNHVSRKHKDAYKVIKKMAKWINWLNTPVASLSAPGVFHYVVDSLDIFGAHLDVAKCKYCRKCGLGPFSLISNGAADHVKSMKNSCTSADIDMDNYAVNWFGSGTKKHFISTAFIVKLSPPLSESSIPPTSKYSDAFDILHQQMMNFGLDEFDLEDERKNIDYLTLAKGMGLACEQTGFVVFSKMFALVQQEDTIVFTDTARRMALALSCDHMYTSDNRVHPDMLAIRRNIYLFFLHGQIKFLQLNAAFQNMIDRIGSDISGQMFKKYRIIEVGTMEAYANKVSVFLCYYVKEVFPAEKYVDVIRLLVESPLSVIPALLAMLLVEPSTVQDLGRSWIDQWMKGAIFLPHTGDPKQPNKMSKTCAAILKFFKVGLAVLHPIKRWTLRDTWPHHHSLEFISVLRFLRGFREIDNGKPVQARVVLNMAPVGFVLTVLEAGVEFEECLKVEFTTPLYSPTLAHASLRLGEKLKQSLEYFLPFVVLNEEDGTFLISVIYGRQPCTYSFEDMGVGLSITFESRETCDLRHNKIRSIVDDWGDFFCRVEELTQNVLGAMHFRPSGSPRAAEYDQLTLLKESGTAFIRSEKHSLFTYMNTRKDKEHPNKFVPRFLDSFVSFAWVFLMNVLRLCTEHEALQYPNFKSHLVPVKGVSDYVLSTVTDILTEVFPKPIAFQEFRHLTSTYHTRLSDSVECRQQFPDEMNIIFPPSDKSIANALGHSFDTASKAYSSQAGTSGLGTTILPNPHNPSAEYLSESRWNRLRNLVIGFEETYSHIFPQIYSYPHPFREYCISLSIF